MAITEEATKKAEIIVIIKKWTASQWYVWQSTFVNGVANEFDRKVIY